jgi:hypothetical protein
MWWVLEPLHAIVYEALGREAVRALDLVDDDMAYFASRSAPFGEATAELAAASFYCFDPGLVRASIPVAWRSSTPAAVLAARLHAVDEAFWDLFGDEIGSDRIERAAELANQAVAMEDPAGRPVFAAHASLDWPTVPHLALWHGATLLREHRGDAHNALLLTEGLDGCAANVLAAAAGAAPAELLRERRGWSEHAWGESTADLVDRGLVRQGVLTRAGAELRDRIERRTDELATGPFARLGRERTAELYDLVAELARPVLRSGVVEFPNAVGLPDKASAVRQISAREILGPKRAERGSDLAGETRDNGASSGEMALEVPT